MALYISNGNKKIEKTTTNVFSLPTSVCFGSGKQCKGCYARKAEYLYPVVLPCRERNYIETLKEEFPDMMINTLRTQKRKIVRIHESGDFYSQEYVNKWYAIAKALPDIIFYGYSKKFNTLNLKKLNKLQNVNIINSLADEIINFGDMDHCKALEKKGFLLCPCEIDKSVKCMKNCFACLTVKKVCFLKH